MKTRCFILLIISLSFYNYAIGQTAKEYKDRGNAKFTKMDYIGAIADYSKAV